jgi:hypothetical protein
MTMTRLRDRAGWFVPAGADLTLLNGGRCPVLLDHNHSIRDVVGVIEAAWIEAETVVVIGRIGHGADAETAWQNIQAGIWRNVSLGNNVMDTERRGDAIIIRSWRPHELSLVWSGACPDAHIDSDSFDMEALHRRVREMRAEAAEQGERASHTLRETFATSTRDRYRDMAHELAAELSISTHEADAAANRIAERHIAAAMPPPAVQGTLP